MAHIKLNLSGHDNPNLPDFVFPGAVHIDLADPDLLDKVAAFLAGFNIGSGDTVTVAVPGLSPFTALVLTALHGMTGNHPFMQLLIRQPDGQYLPGALIDLQAFRNDVARAQHRQGAVIL